jgi:hypothetical protein
MYAWARPDYLLDHMSIEELYMYLDYGLEFEEIRAALIIQKLNEALGGKKVARKKGPDSDKPDKKAFYKHYGDKIKRPEGGEGK